MKNKFLISIFIFVSITITFLFAKTQPVSEDDFEWLVVFDFPQDDHDFGPYNNYRSNGDDPFTGDFHEGLAIVASNGKGGYINTEGKLVIKFQRGICRNFHDGLAAVKKGNLWGYIDREGKFIIKPQFDNLGVDVGDFHEGLARIGYDGYINKQGKLVIKFDEFHILGDFHEGLASIGVSGKWGYINKQGKLVIKTQYNFGAGDFSGGRARVNMDGIEGDFYIDKKGKVISSTETEFEFEEEDAEVKAVNEFHEGLILYTDSDENGHSKYGYKDKQDKIVIKAQFDEAHIFSEGFALVKKGDKRGFIKHPSHSGKDQLTKNLNNYKKVISSKSIEPDLKANYYNIGDRGPAGGWIFYDKGNSKGGWRYLEAAPEDQGTNTWWGADAIYKTKTGIGTGKLNTKKIIADNIGKPNQYGEICAAKLCADYQGGGKNDWFLPSKDELNLMYVNLAIKDLGNFTLNEYWSSSKINSSEIWAHRFDNSYNYDNRQYRTNKYNCEGIYPSVRAIRAF